MRRRATSGPRRTNTRSSAPCSHAAVPRQRRVAVAIAGAPGGRTRQAAGRKRELADPNLRRDRDPAARVRARRRAGRGRQPAHGRRRWRRCCRRSRSCSGREGHRLPRRPGGTRPDDRAGARDARRPSNRRACVDGVYITTSLDVLRGRIAGAGRRPARFRAYVGYAGWGAGQLDDEIARGDWHLTAGEPALLFAKDRPGRLWPAARERAHQRPLGRARRRPGRCVAQRSSGGVALPPPARNAWRASTLAFTS